ncbi:hypothetical protein [uncultured Winogradskyella sp.]|uniref:hypothetical protein n=1 Tax=uncultured Winogradskyella sp. TaxID=395353 RepID=UPI002624AC9E|nr:hypothetical protein [uncultured Winogradskyella sp.]
MKGTLKKISEIYSDSKLSPGEITEFKTLSDRAVVDILQLEGDEGVTNALCKSFEVTNQLLQQTMLKFKKENKNEDYKKALANMVFAQMELLKANIHLFTN